MKTIAIVGLGEMGVRMAARLLNDGQRLVVHNRTPSKAKGLLEQGAIWADNPKQAVEQADIAFSMVTDNDASERVWLHPEDGGFLGLRPGKTIVESSTLTPSWIQSLHHRATEAGAEFLDAPVAGSRPQAEQGKLVFLVGGPTEKVEELTPLLKVMGGAVLHAGNAGAGSALKLAVNALFGIQVAAMSEVLGMLERSGIAKQEAIEMLGNTPVVSPALKGAGGLIASENYAPLFPINLVEKDFRYVVETATKLGAQTPISEATRQVYQRAQEEGLGNLNIVGVAKLFQHS